MNRYALTNSPLLHYPALGYTATFVGIEPQARPTVMIYRGFLYFLEVLQD